MHHDEAGDHEEKVHSGQPVPGQVEKCGCVSTAGRRHADLLVQEDMVERDHERRDPAQGLDGIEGHVDRPSQGRRDRSGRLPGRAKPNQCPWGLKAFLPELKKKRPAPSERASL